MAHIDILRTSIDYLVNDGRYDRDELVSLVNIALEDGVVTEDERRVLRDIFETAQVHGIDTDTQAVIVDLSLRYDL